MKITKMPYPFLWALKSSVGVNQGECFTNCGFATILPSVDCNYSDMVKERGLKIEYVIGILSPPGHEPTPHAWLKVTDQDKIYYWDPTLQEHSGLWNSSLNKFGYEQTHTFNHQEILDWWKHKYPNRPKDSNGIPEGNSRFPIVDHAKVLQ
ncbi:MULTISPECIES: hypothetical protein [Vibrio harveyi group]|uniref:hypothetical protein n=1 Tax=Vibrio harveyi group TaxID=717610 RepID=UPI001BD5DFDA|nr:MULTISPECIES: hypothetical protein [Vibrio harveyi group]HCM1039271.1 hypothetical protein [Vibrio parahaemolyticus]MBS9908125.1 hypothetical protein [Vibrio alginolyticus]MBS9986060.1 hypothetical protein [Vibrio alginolyticus]MCR9445333.1 hypothetical protein [Vibrio alginolyticus]MCR9450025.1 hypothetical protein [Vibrio alginolyticus]